MRGSSAVHTAGILLLLDATNCMTQTFTLTHFFRPFTSKIPHVSRYAMHIRFANIDYIMSDIMIHPTGLGGEKKDGKDLQ